MKRFPIELACYFEYRGVRPKEKRRFALDCVSVGPTSVNYLVRHHRIHCFAVNWLRVQERRKTNCNREENYPKRGEGKEAARPISCDIHHSGDEFPNVAVSRES